MLEESTEEIARKIAASLRMNSTMATRLVQGKTEWWLVGCLEGDQPLPNTEGCKSVSEAVKSFEDWLSNKE
jgi:thiazole synthase ThiGH ThiG subunit